MNPFSAPVNVINAFTLCKLEEDGSFSVVERFGGVATATYRRPRPGGQTFLESREWSTNEITFDSDGFSCSACANLPPGFHRLKLPIGLKSAVVRGNIQDVVWQTEEGDNIGAGFSFSGNESATYCCFRVDPPGLLPVPGRLYETDGSVLVEIHGRGGRVSVDACGSTELDMTDAPRAAEPLLVELVRSETLFEARLRVLAEEGLLPRPITLYLATILAFEIIVAVVL